MTIKVTMFFQAENYSWSESHYLLTQTLFGPSITSCGVLATARAALLGYYAYLVNVRMSFVPANRQIYDLPRSNWPYTAPPGSGSTPPDQQSDAPYSALMLNIQGVGANKNLYLAGIPDDIIQFLPNSQNGYAPTAGFSGALAQYMAVLTGGLSFSSWGFRSRLPQPNTQVVAVGTQAGYGNNAGVSTRTDPGVARGTEAYLKGFKTNNPRLPNLSGAYQVVDVLPPGSGQPNWITILGETGNVDGSNFLSFGYIQQLAWSYVAYTNWRVVRATHRKRGGSYGLPRGRSRVRR